MCKHYLLFFVLFLSFSGSTYALEPVSMRTLAIEQMYIYGEAIFDRGNYPEAAKVFSRILAIMPDYKETIGYAEALNKKGQHVVIPIRPVVVESLPSAVALKTDLSDPNGDLKLDIQATDERIEKLKKDISNLNQQIATGQE